MIAETKKAVLRQTETAAKNIFHNEAYLKAEPLSSLKTKIGEFLLFKNPNWREFEAMLRKYIDQKLNEVSYE